MGCSSSRNVVVSEDGQPALERDYSAEREPSIDKKFAEVNDPESAIDNLRTGDIILFHCDHSGDKVKQYFDWTSWDHVAMVVRMSDNPNTVQARHDLVNEKGSLPKKMYGKGFEKIDFQYEASKSGQIQLLDAGVDGTFCYPFMQRLVSMGPKYHYVAVRKLSPPLTDEQCSKVEAFVHEVWGRPYETKYLEMIKPVLRRYVKIEYKNDETLQNFFCSEITAAALQRAGVLGDESFASDDVVPSMFEYSGPIDKLMAKHGTHTLGEHARLIVSPGNKICVRCDDSRFHIHTDTELEEVLAFSGHFGESSLAFSGHFGEQSLAFSGHFGMEDRAPGKVLKE